MASGVSRQRRARLTAIQAFELITADSDSEFSDLDDMDDPEDDFHDPIFESVIAQDEPSTSSTDNSSGNATWQHLRRFDSTLPIWSVQYNKQSGPNLPDTFDVPNATPYDYFTLYFPDEVYNLLSNMINLYALQYFDQPCELSRSSRFLTWKDTTPNEVKTYVGIQIAMALCAKPKIEDYWRKKCQLTRTTGFADVMSRNRYQLLNSFLHFMDNTEYRSRGDRLYDPLQKIRPLLNLTTPCLSKYYIPKKELSIDETMRKFKGRIYFKQYMPIKPSTKWGIKIWSLCESKTGYLLNYEIYTGKKNVPVGPEGLGHRVVVDLLDPGYLDIGHHIYTDSFYTSPSLFQLLHDRTTGACGTVNPKRRGMPQQLRSITNLKKGDPPVYFKRDNFVVCHWHDTSKVTLLSTIDGNGVTSKTIRSRDSESGFREISKPNIADNYNSFMGGVDLFDQLCSTLPFPHKCQKWYHTIYHFVKEVALVNGYILFRSVNPNSTIDQVKFREQVAEKLASFASKATAEANRTNIDPPRLLTNTSQ